jgi:peptide/nickel transport system substrate-binding protein
MRKAECKRRALFAFCILTFALIPGCSRSPAAVPSSYIVLGIRTAPNGLDPRFVSDESSSRVAQLMFDSLMDIGDDLRVRPRLAERLDNPDPLTYIAHLRRGVRFHDGHELTSADVVFTYREFLDPAFISPWKGAFDTLASVTALDRYTVQFTLKTPFAAFPIQLVNPPVVPAGAGEDLRRHPVGTGPYRFVNYAVDDQLAVSAFDQYWDGRPKNDGIIVKVVPDDTTRGLELRKGSIDLAINDIPPDIVYQLERTGRVRVDREPGVDFFYLGFNLRDRVLSDRCVRHAIGYAIDRDALINYMRRGLARPAYGLIPPQAWAFEPDVFQFSYDPEKARRLLDDAGYRDPDGNGPMPRLRLTMKTSTNEEYRLQATVIQQDLARVGIDLELQSYEFATFYADVIQGNFQVFALQWVGSSMADPDILRRVFASDQVPPAGFNRGHYSNPDVDRLIALASRSASEPQRKAYYGAAQKLIADDAPYIPIWNRVNAVVRRPSLSGLHLGPTSDFSALRNVVKAPTP